MKKICFFTGTRADYGLLKPLMEEIRKDKHIKLQIIASGSHLSAEFGLTYRDIEKDGFLINRKIEILLDADTPISISKAVGLGLISYCEALNQLKPAMTVILGDRYEALACAIASYIQGIPIAHIHGGEVTEGVIDEAFRHSITKMSYLHFTSTEEYRKRVIQLGERPNRVFNVGGLGIDNIKKMKLLSKNNLEKEIGFKFVKHNLLVTFHPVTLEIKSSQNYFKNILAVLNGLKDTNIIFTRANADTGGRIINKMIDEFVALNKQRAIAFASLGQMRYLSVMKYIDAIVGNSSSGIIEAPSFKIGTINIGDRQKGRIKAKSVIDCKPNRNSIFLAIQKLYTKGFQNSLIKTQNPYGDGNASKRIKKIMKQNNSISVIKSFYDLNSN